MEECKSGKVEGCGSALCGAKKNALGLVRERFWKKLDLRSESRARNCKKRKREHAAQHQDQRSGLRSLDDKFLLLSSQSKSGFPHIGDNLKSIRVDGGVVGLRLAEPAADIARGVIVVRSGF